MVQSWLPAQASQVFRIFSKQGKTQQYRRTLNTGYVHADWQCPILFLWSAVDVWKKAVAHCIHDKNGIVVRGVLYDKLEVWSFKWLSQLDYSWLTLWSLAHTRGFQCYLQAGWHHHLGNRQLQVPHLDCLKRLFSFQNSLDRSKHGPNLHDESSWSWDLRKTNEPRTLDVLSKNNT